MSRPLLTKPLPFKFKRKFKNGNARQLSNEAKHERRKSERKSGHDRSRDSHWAGSRRSRTHVHDEQFSGGRHGCAASFAAIPAGCCCSISGHGISLRGDVCLSRPHDEKVEPEPDKSPGGAISGGAGVGIRDFESKRSRPLLPLAESRTAYA